MKRVEVYYTLLPELLVEVPLEAMLVTPERCITFLA